MARTFDSVRIEVIPTAYAKTEVEYQRVSKMTDPSPPRYTSRQHESDGLTLR